MSTRRAALSITHLVVLLIGVVGCDGQNPNAPVAFDYGVRRCEDDQDMLVGRVGVANHDAEVSSVPGTCGCGSDGPKVITNQSERVTFWARDYRCDDLKVPCSTERQVGDVESSVQVAHGYYAHKVGGVSLVNDFVDNCPFVLETGWVAEPTCAQLMTMQGHVDGVSGHDFAEWAKKCMQTNLPPIVRGAGGRVENDPWFNPPGDERDNDGFDQENWLENRLGQPAWDAAVRCMRDYIEERSGHSWDNDGDDVCSTLDNCPNVSNHNQRNTDYPFDGHGDECDEDDDEDGLTDVEERNDYATDPLRRDSDGDGYGDGSEARGDDNNGPYLKPEVVGGAVDPLDLDGDGLIDPLDTDSDNDGALDSWSTQTRFRHPEDPNEKEQRVDTDHDGLLDVHDLDSDNDGVPDGPAGGEPMDHDNCRQLANHDQEDQDGDDIGDRCDSDRDGDGLFNDGWTTDPNWTFEDVPVEERDNCPDLATDDPQENEDEDGDGFGAACDACDEVPENVQVDTDGDGLGDACDNCPHVPNSNQELPEYGVPPTLGEACAFLSLRALLPSPEHEDRPRDNPRAQPTIENQRVYSADAPARLRVRARVSLFSEEPPETFERRWIFDPIGRDHGGIENPRIHPEIVEETWTPMEDDANGYTLDGVAEYTGMPTDARDFGGQYFVHLELWREGEIVAISSESEFEVFWPLFINPEILGVARFDDGNFARNYPGVPLPEAIPSIPPGADVWANSVYNEDDPASRDTVILTARVPPNWFFYLLQDWADDYPYVHELHPIYATSDGPPFASAAWVGLMGREIGGGQLSTMFNDVVILPPATWPRALLPGEPLPQNGDLSQTKLAAQLHHTLVHEHRHMQDSARWTKDGRNVVAPYGNRARRSYWSFSVRDDTSPAWNHFRDLDGNEASRPRLRCDLDGDQDLNGLVAELNVEDACGHGIGEDGDINHDGRYDNFLLEADIESLDWDLDDVPNWEDPNAFDVRDEVYGRDREAGPTEAERAFALGHRNDLYFRLISWHYPGANYAQPQ